MQDPGLDNRSGKIMFWWTGLGPLVKLKSGWHIKPKYCVMLDFLNSNTVVWLYRRIPKFLGDAHKYICKM